MSVTKKSKEVEQYDVCIQRLGFGSDLSRIIIKHMPKNTSFDDLINTYERLFKEFGIKQQRVVEKLQVRGEINVI